MDKDRMKKMVKQLCLIGIVFSNIGLLMSCVLVCVSIIHKEREIFIFCIEIHVFFLVSLHVCNYFKNYLD